MTNPNIAHTPDLATFGNIQGGYDGVLPLFRTIEEVAKTIDSELVVNKRVNAYGGYEYMDLSHLEDILRPVLSERDLALDFPATHTHQGARIVDLKSGAFKASWLPIGVSSNMQDNGKQFTYNQRYAALNGLLGRRASKDTDGNDASKVSSRGKSSRPKSSGHELNELDLEF